jgi:hypothetical protein
LLTVSGGHFDVLRFCLPTNVKLSLHSSFFRFALLLCSALFFSSCGEEVIPEQTGIETGAGAELLWETPPVPGPYKMTLDGVEIPEVVLTQFLTPAWNTFYLENQDEPGAVSVEVMAKMVGEFYVDPATLMQPVIRDFLIVRRHEENHAEINPHDFEHFVEEFDANAGETRAILVHQMGEVGLNNHLERRFRLREMMKEFNAQTGNVSHEEIEAYFNSKRDAVRADMLASGKVSAEAVDEMLTLDDDTLHELIENQLLQERIEQVIDAWIVSIAADTKVEFSGPDGKLVEIPVQTRN